MGREMVWLSQERFQGGVALCAHGYSPSTPLVGRSIEEMKRRYDWNAIKSSRLRGVSKSENPLHHKNSPVRRKSAHPNEHFHAEQILCLAWSDRSRFRRCNSAYKARTSQTTKQIITRVPIKPYPNIVASTEYEFLGFKSDKRVCITDLAVYVLFRTQSVFSRIIFGP
jgi:hypothetical protein